MIFVLSSSQSGLQSFLIFPATPSAQIVPGLQHQLQSKVSADSLGLLFLPYMGTAQVLVPYHRMMLQLGTQTWLIPD